MTEKRGWLWLASLSAVIGCSSPVAPIQTAAVASSAGFRLSIESAAPSFGAGTPLEIEATLVYVGSMDFVQVEGPRIVFGWGYEEVGGHRRDEIALDIFCAGWSMKKGQPMVDSYPRTASWSLPPGTWRTYAVSQVGIDRDLGNANRACDVDTELRVEVVITIT